MAPALQWGRKLRLVKTGLWRGGGAQQDQLATRLLPWRPGSSSAGVYAAALIA